VNDTRTIPIIIPGPALQPEPAAPVESEDAFTPHARSSRALGALGKVKEVDYERLRENLEKIQGELGETLASLDREPASNGFSLSEVSVALAVSGEGSIGVASVGVEASITLTFSRGG